LSSLKELFFVYGFDFFVVVLYLFRVD
jgi:hypothetical protein